MLEKAFYLLLFVQGSVLIGGLLIFPQVLQGIRSIRKAQYPDLQHTAKQPVVNEKPSVYLHPNIWSKPNPTGEYGEKLTSQLLKRISGENRILRNLYIPKLDGQTAELDIVLINETGIYVIESKNVGGWIFGNDKHHHWTVTYRGGMKHTLINPVWQNNGHINALRQYLGDVHGVQYYSYIVFSERCELKNLTVQAKNVTVLKRNELLDRICQDMNQRPPTLTLDQVNTIHNHLLKLTNATDQVKAQHLWDIKKRTTAQ